MSIHLFEGALMTRSPSIPIGSTSLKKIGAPVGLLFIQMVETISARSFTDALPIRSMNIQNNSCKNHKVMLR